MKTKFIAEICSNHNGDLDRALALIDAAKAIGCDGVKFQLFRINELFHESILTHPDYQAKLEARRQWEIPLEWLPILSERCKDLGIEFGCTPFYLDAVNELFPHVDFYKVASYELLWLDLIEKISQTGRPLIMSTGMATLTEIHEAVSRFQCSHTYRSDPKLTLLHCVSAYPTAVEQCHLGCIGELRSYPWGRHQYGWSDHSVNAAVIYRAVHRYKADVVEFHLDLPDKAGGEYSLGHCWLPDQMKAVIRTLREGESADGWGMIDVEKQSDRAFRADPSDGLRPLQDTRRMLLDGKT